MAAVLQVQVAYRFRQDALLTENEMVAMSRMLGDRLTYAQLVEATYFLMADPKIDDKARYGGTLHAADWIRASEKGASQVFSHREMISLCSKDGLTTDDFVMIEGDPPSWRRR